MSLPPYIYNYILLRLARSMYALPKGFVWLRIGPAVCFAFRKVWAALMTGLHQPCGVRARRCAYPHVCMWADNVSQETKEGREKSLGWGHHQSACSTWMRSFWKARAPKSRVRIAFLADECYAMMSWGFVWSDLTLSAPRGAAGGRPLPLACPPRTRLPRCT